MVFWQDEFSQAEREHLARGGTVYHYGFKWRYAPGCETSLRVGPYFNREDGEAEFAASLHKAGYRVPVWWEYWRWGEDRPSKNVLKHLEGRE